MTLVRANQASSNLCQINIGKFDTAQQPFISHDHLPQHNIQNTHSLLAQLLEELMPMLWVPFPPRSESIGGPISIARVNSQMGIKLEEFTVVPMDSLVLEIFEVSLT